ncbi:hypothetical protein [Modestobacter sp. Leaf380]|uniref:hypothetical protein n=1 Tax=Modestobacter sp. Leaf380 TaxID=1736356 RepID=UPI0035103055
MIAAFQRMIGADPALDVLVAREPRLALGRDRVDVVGAAQGGDADLLLAAALQHAEHQVAGAALAGVVDDGVERLQPLTRLVGVVVDQLARQAVGDDRAGGAGLAGGFSVRLLRGAHVHIVSCPVFRRHAASGRVHSGRGGDLSVTAP